MKELNIEDLPPSMKGEAIQARQMIREQILGALARSDQQHMSTEKMQRKLAIKAKRRIRKAQARKGRR